MKLNKKGFTLVELLAVILILAILGAILITSTSNIIKNSRRDSFIQTVDMVEEAAELACSQDDGLSAEIIQSYVKNYSTGSVIVGYEDNRIIITAKDTGSFKDVTKDMVETKLQNKFGASNISVSTVSNEESNNGMVRVSLSKKCD